MLNRRELIAALGAAAVAGAVTPAGAENRTMIDKRVRMAIDTMYAREPHTRELAGKAHGMLVMPRVLKGGFILGGAYGEGALLENGPQGYQGQPAAYYSVASASVGLQAGVQRTSHALFFMTEAALKQFRLADGWEIGADAEVTFPAAGLNLQMNSTMQNKPVIGVVFAQDGMLVGASLEGAKYSRVNR